MESNTKIAVLPDALDSPLQSLHVCLNQSFEDHMREARNNWMYTLEKLFTNVEATHAAPLDILCDFVIKDGINKK